MATDKEKMDREFGFFLIALLGIAVSTIAMTLEMHRSQGARGNWVAIDGAGQALNGFMAYYWLKKLGGKADDGNADTEQDDTTYDDED